MTEMTASRFLTGEDLTDDTHQNYKNKGNQCNANAYRIRNITCSLSVNSKVCLAYFLLLLYLYR